MRYYLHLTTVYLNEIIYNAYLWVCVCVFQITNEIVLFYNHKILFASMKVSPLSPPMSTKEQKEEPLHNDLDDANNCLKRRRLHSQTNIIINGHYRQRKHIYPRDEDKSSSMDCFNVVSSNINGNSNSSCNSSNSGEDVSDCDDSSIILNSYPNQKNPEGKMLSPPPDHDKKVRSLHYKCA